MAGRKWCSICKGMLYNDGCKKCDDDYYGTLLVMLENEISCIEWAKDMDEVKKHTECMKETFKELWELRPLEYYSNLKWRM